MLPFGSFLELSEVLWSSAELSGKETRRNLIEGDRDNCYNENIEFMEVIRVLKACALQNRIKQRRSHMLIHGSGCAFTGKERNIKMMELGKRQLLEIVRLTEIGAYVGEKEKPDQAVLLPRRQVPEGAQPGDKVDVLLYKDSEDRMIATTAQSRIVRDQLAFLRVVQVTPIGVFLDWGLEKDLFMPFKEQKGKPQEGEECLVTLYVDKSERLCATMKIYDHLTAPAPYKKGDMVSGTVYEIKGMGAFVAVDDRYFGLIPASEVYQDLRPGERVTAQVTKKRADGKLDLRVRKKAYKQMDEDAELLWIRLAEAGGRLPYGDKSDPDEIREAFGLSKAAFKRAAGHLLKDGRIRISDNEMVKI